MVNPDHFERLKKRIVAFFWSEKRNVKLVCCDVIPFEDKSSETSLGLTV